MNFFERRAIKRIQQELGPFLGSDEVITNFDTSVFLMMYDERGRGQPRGGTTRLAISTHSLWIAIPPQIYAPTQLLQAKWGEILEFGLSEDQTWYRVVLVDGRQFVFSVKFPRRLELDASEHLRKVEAQMTPTQILDRRERLQQTNLPSWL